MPVVSTYLNIVSCPRTRHWGSTTTARGGRHLQKRLETRHLCYFHHK